MNMSQSGGFILTGIKLCPVTGHNELDDKLLKELRDLVGGRRGKQKKTKQKKSRKRGKGAKTEPSTSEPDPKRSRSENEATVSTTK